MKLELKVFAGGLGLVVIVGVVAGLGFSSSRQSEAKTTPLVFNWSGVDQYFFYRLFMNWAAGGVVGRTDYSLPPAVAAEFKPYFDYDLSAVRFAYSANFAGSDLSDCAKIYFGDQAFVGALRTGRTLTREQAGRLALELARGEQCLQAGGRKNYAEAWFDAVPKEARDAILASRFTDAVKPVLEAQSAAAPDAVSPAAAARVRAEAVMRDWH